VGTMGERTFVSLEFVLSVCELRVYVVCLFVCCTGVKHTAPIPGRYLFFFFVCLLLLVP